MLKHCLEAWKGCLGMGGLLCWTSPLWEHKARVTAWGEQCSACSRPKPLYCLSTALWDHGEVLAQIEMSTFRLCLAGSSSGGNGHRKQTELNREVFLPPIVSWIHVCIAYRYVYVNPEFNKGMEEFLVISRPDFAWVRDFFSKCVLYFLLYAMWLAFKSEQSHSSLALNLPCELQRTASRYFCWGFRKKKANMA